LYARAKIVPSKAKPSAKQPLKKKPFQKAKTPAKKEIVKKKLFQKAKVPAKQIVKKNPFQKAEKPAKKQIVKKKPFQKAKTPAKQIVKKKPFTRAKTPSKQVVKKKTFQKKGKFTPSKQQTENTKVLKIQKKRRNNGPAIVDGLFGQVFIVGGTLAVSLAASLVLGFSYIKPTSSIGVLVGKAPTTTVKAVPKNAIGNRKNKPTKTPQYDGYNLDNLGALPPKVQLVVEEKKPEAAAPAADSESK